MFRNCHDRWIISLIKDSYRLILVQSYFWLLHICSHCLIFLEPTNWPSYLGQDLLLTHLWPWWVNSSRLKSLGYLSLNCTLSDPAICSSHLPILVRWLVIFLNDLFPEFHPLLPLSWLAICINATDNTCILFIYLSDSASSQVMSINPAISMVVIAGSIVHSAVKRGISARVCINWLPSWLAIDLFWLISFNLTH